MTQIVKGKQYKIKGNSKYFKEKYGESNPIFAVEDADFNVFENGKDWSTQNGNPTAMLFAMRSGFEHLPFSGTVYYGHIGHLAELVHESELEEIK